MSFKVECNQCHAIGPVDTLTETVRYNVGKDWEESETFCRRCGNPCTPIILPTASERRMIAAFRTDRSYAR